MTFINNNNKL